MSQVYLTLQLNNRNDELRFRISAAEETREDSAEGYNQNYDDGRQDNRRCRCRRHVSRYSSVSRRLHS